MDDAAAVVSMGQAVGDMAHSGVTLENGGSLAMGPGSLLLGRLFRNCFSRDTLVATPTGPRPIGEIRPGELVLAHDFTEGCHLLRARARRPKSRLREVVDSLRTLHEAGADYDDFVDALRILGQIAAGRGM